MFKLLDDLIQRKRDDTDAYEQLLRGAEALAKGKGRNGAPARLHGNGEATRGIFEIIKNLTKLGWIRQPPCQPTGSSTRTSA